MRMHARKNTHTLTIRTGSILRIQVRAWFKKFMHYASVHACHWKSYHSFRLLIPTNSYQNDVIPNRL